MAQVILNQEGKNRKILYILPKPYATKACTNKDDINLRNVIGKARQSLLEYLN